LDVDAISAGKAARQELSEVEARGEADAPPVGMYDVEFPLRDDLRLTFTLPTDLNDREVERISTLIQPMAK
jgi:hypothetical protein